MRYIYIAAVGRSFSLSRSREAARAARQGKQFLETQCTPVITDAALFTNLKKN